MLFVGCIGGRATGPDEITVEFWKNMDGKGMEWPTELFNVIIKMTNMHESWRWSKMLLKYKNKCDIQNCNKYRGIMLLCC